MREGVRNQVEEIEELESNMQSGKLISEEEMGNAYVWRKHREKTPSPSCRKTEKRAIQHAPGSAFFQELIVAQKHSHICTRTQWREDKEMTKVFEQ